MYRQREKKLLNSNTSCTCPDNIVNFGLLTAEICWRVWGIPANFNGFCFLAALLHGTLVVGVSQTVRRWTEGATYIRQGSHHVGHWPTFLVISFFVFLSFLVSSSRAQVAPVDRVWRSICHMTSFCPRMCLLWISLIRLPTEGGKI